MADVADQGSIEGWDEVKGLLVVVQMVAFRGGCACGSKSLVQGLAGQGAHARTS